MKKWLARLLYRWAHRFDPGVSLQLPGLPEPEAVSAPTRYAVQVDGRIVVETSSGSYARRVYELSQNPGRHAHVVFLDNGKVRGEWERGW